MALKAAFLNDTLMASPGNCTIQELFREHLCVAASPGDNLPRFNLKSLLVATALLACLFFAVNMALRQPNDLNQRAIETILLSEDSPSMQLAKLKPYVQIGESIQLVNQRISPRPEQSITTGRPTQVAVGLRGVNLELYYGADGIISGIGRYIHDDDDGIVWFHPPP
jgi:hypothetical protein